MRRQTVKKISTLNVDDSEEQIVSIAKTIDYFVSEYTIELLAQKLEKNEFVIPGYQREFTWEYQRKCKFIESILMGLPIPFIFFWERPESGELEIVDGTQRLRTIHEFIYKGLELNNLQKLFLLNGFSYNDLKRSRQLKFKNRSIRGIVLSEKADLESRLDLFERINTGSKTANSSEIRRAALSGSFIELIIELAKDALFVELTPMNDKHVKEREREELVTRFFAYGDGLENYSENVTQFLYDYCKKMNEKFDKQSTLKVKYAKRFHDTMQFIKKHFPNGFKKTATAKTTRRARFESLAIGTYLALNEKQTLMILPKNINNLLNSTKLDEHARSDGANVISRLTGRINYTRDTLLGKK